MKRNAVLLFNAKGLGDQSMRPLNPGININLAPKGMHGSVAGPVAVRPFDDEVLVSPELVSAHKLKIPEIMKGLPGRLSKNKPTMRHWSYWIMSKTSAYRWLRKQEESLRGKSNLAAGFEQHGLSFSEYKYKSTNHMVGGWKPSTLENLAKVEPLAFRCYAEVVRSDNMLAYDRFPNFRAERREGARRAQQRQNTFVMRNPLPTRRRLPDPSWREIPYESGKSNDSTFHAQHPIFLVDWKI